MASMILTGDVNLMNVDDPTAPFARVQDEFHAADIVFSNLECCFYDPPRGHAVESEGFYASPPTGEALRSAGIGAVGIANNVNYGAANIAASIARLDEVGVLHTGAGPNLAAARAPAIVARNGLRVGVLQRSSVYWPTDHEASDDAPGIAVEELGETCAAQPSGAGGERGVGVGWRAGARRVHAEGAAVRRTAAEDVRLCVIALKSPAPSPLGESRFV